MTWRATCTRPYLLRQLSILALEELGLIGEAAALQVAC